MWLLAAAFINKTVDYYKAHNGSINGLQASDKENVI